MRGESIKRQFMLQWTLKRILAVFNESKHPQREHRPAHWGLLNNTQVYSLLVSFPLLLFEFVQNVPVMISLTVKDDDLLQWYWQKITLCNGNGQREQVCYKAIKWPSTAGQMLHMKTTMTSGGGGRVGSGDGIIYFISINQKMTNRNCHLSKQGHLPQKLSYQSFAI